MYAVADLGKGAPPLFWVKKIAEGKSPPHPLPVAPPLVIRVVSLLYCICILCIRRQLKKKFSYFSSRTYFMVYFYTCLFKNLKTQ